MVLSLPDSIGSARSRTPAMSSHASDPLTLSTWPSAALNRSVDARFEPLGASRTALTNSVLEPNTTMSSVTA